MFLANYSDGLTTCRCPTMIEHFRATTTVASFARLAPTQLPPRRRRTTAGRHGASAT